MMEKTIFIPQKMVTLIMIASILVTDIVDEMGFANFEILMTDQNFKMVAKIFFVDRIPYFSPTVSYQHLTSMMLMVISLLKFLMLVTVRE